MANPTFEQIQEFFRQIEKGFVTKETLQEVIERGKELALSQIIHQIINSAYNQARSFADPVMKINGLIDLEKLTVIPKIKEIQSLVEGNNPEGVNFRKIGKIVEESGAGPCCFLWDWIINQIKRINDPFKRSLQFSSIALSYFVVALRNPDVGDILDEAKKAFVLLKDEDEKKQNKARKAIAEAHARISGGGSWIISARNWADEITMPYFSALAYTDIFGSSKNEDDFNKVIEFSEKITEHWAGHIFEGLVATLCEIGDLQKAWEICHRISLKEWRPNALLSIIKLAVKENKKNSIETAMHYLMDPQFRWWRVQGHLLIAAENKKIASDRRRKIIGSINLLQDAGHRAEAYASLANVSCIPEDLDFASRELQSIVNAGEKFRTTVTVIDNYYNFKKQQ